MANEILLLIGEKTLTAKAAQLLDESSQPFRLRNGDLLNDLGSNSIFTSSYYTGFCNRLKQEAYLPALIWREHPYDRNPEVYFSFSGVKSYVRNVHKFRQSKKESSEKKDWTKTIDTFFASWNGYQVTCFDKNEKIFAGPLKESPHAMEPVLNAHDYKSWHDVGSRKLGSLDEIKFDNMPFFRFQETGAVLLKDDVDALKCGKIVVTNDNCSIYHVHFEALYACQDQVYELYAYMFD
jgi:hypothetical protein